MKKTILFLLILGLFKSVYSQESEAKRDSSKIYKNLESFAKKKKFTHTLYKAFFRPVSTLNKKKSKKFKADTFEKYEGKIIRSIKISTYDPFGFDIHDTTKSPTNPWAKAGNSFHVKSSQFAIRNQLLFKVGDELDELKIKETERILRRSLYVKEVMIYPVKAPGDSVDIYIREIDVWTTLPKYSTVNSNSKFQLTELNLIGTGHQFAASIQFVPGNDNIYEGIYTIPNFKNTFFSTTVYLKADFDSIFYSGASINRPFYSPLTKWAGGVSFAKISTSDTLFYTDVIRTIPDIKYNQYDVWAGKSWKLFKDYSDVNRITNLVLTGRMLNVDFRSNPLLGTDTFGLLTDEKFYLSGIGISQRMYIKDKYIFKFGLDEDVPTGQVIAFTVGRQFIDTANRTYLGARIGWGNYLSRSGYLSFNAEYGTFKNADRFEQGVLNIDLVYFTNLIELGQWKMRQFIRTRLTIGTKPLVSQVLNINRENGIQGFNSDILYGTKRLVFSTQTQLYAPYSVIGFHFAPNLYLTGALISTDDKSLFSSRLYSAIGLGVLIRNEYLVFSNFQIALAFYPIIPGKGNNILRFNSIKTYDFQLQDFDLERPGKVKFN